MTIDLGALAARRGVDLRVWPPRYDPDYLPDADTDSWVPELERADPTERDQVILAKLHGQLRYAWERS